MKQIITNIYCRKHHYVCIFLLIASLTIHGQSNVDIDALLSKMTVEEKVGQMTQLNLDVICDGEIYNLLEPHRIHQEKLHQAIVQYHVGSILNCGGHAYPLTQWHTIISEIQNVAMHNTRLHIPVIYGIDAIHGANYTLGSTLFPQPLAQAATWNPALVKSAAEITAYEVRASGIPWNFSPVLDVGRDTRWSRFFETYGEDVLLAKTMGNAAIAGYQGDTLASGYRVAACMKHFLGYSIPRTGKDRTPVYLDEIQLREYFLPTFQSAIENGASTVMINSGEINGTPVHANKDILITLLRDELHFTGVAVTDWEDIMKLHNIHMVAPTLKEAVHMAIEAGIDMCMVPNDYNFTTLLIELVKEGTIPESRLDISVKRILQLKKDLGLFEQPFTPNTINYSAFGSAAFAKVSQTIAEESITLLKNNNEILPLKEDTKIFITGPAANSMTWLNGAWTRTWQGVDTTWDNKNNNTIQEAFPRTYTQYLPPALMHSEDGKKQLLASANAADVILLCLGEGPSTEKVGDIHHLTLPEEQQTLTTFLAQTGKPMILILVENRPMLVNNIEPLCAAVIIAYEPGDYGADALANIIYGKINPSGKLPFTYPRYEASLLLYDHKHTETLDTKFGRDAFNPQWEFGFGMSYATFDYQNIKLNKDTLQHEEILISVDVTNTSTVAGKEVVQLYVADRYASITPSVKRLRAFEKIVLQPEETKTICFSISENDLAFVDKNHKWITEEGWFDVFIGDEKTAFYVKK